MPETVNGQSGVPSRRDSERTSRDRLARIEEQLAALTIAVTDLADRFADAEAEAEEILRRAAAPVRHRAPRRNGGRRGDTVLRVVKVALLALLGVGVVVAAMAPQRIQQRQYGPRCSVACARAVARVDSDHDVDAR